MSDSLKNNTEAQETEYAVKPTKRARAKRHCLRFWWAYLIALICIIVLVVCLIIFVGVPNIAQKKIDEAELTIDSIVASNTRADNFTMSVNSTIRIASATSATIDAFEGIMYLTDFDPVTPFAKLQFPQTTGDSLQVVNLTQFTPIEDRVAFTRFNTWLLMNDSIHVTVEGDTKVQVSGLNRKYGVTFKKTVELIGLKNFEGTFLPYSKVSLQADENGDNFHGTVTVPNKSVVTFDIGNASFTSYFEGAMVGTTYIDDMVLRPGLNNFTMHANIEQKPVLTALGKKPYCEQNGTLPFQLSGKAVVNNGEHLSYYADALASGNQTVDIPIGTDLARDYNYKISCSK
jgi:hypothetical protein